MLHLLPSFSDLKILKLYDLLDLKLLTFAYESVNRISPFGFTPFSKPCQMFINMILGRLIRAIFV